LSRNWTDASRRICSRPFGSHVLISWTRVCETKHETHPHCPRRCPYNVRRRHVCVVTGMREQVAAVEREFIFHIAKTLEQVHNRNAKLGGLPERHLAHQSWPPVLTAKGRIAAATYRITSAHAGYSLYSAMGRKTPPPQIADFCGGPGPPSNTRLPGPARVHRTAQAATRSVQPFSQNSLS